jgi:dienelactone hydrolase
MNASRRLHRNAITLLALTITAAAVIAGASVDQKKRNDELAMLIRYDASTPFDLKEVSAREENGVLIKDFDYAGYTDRHGHIKAYIVKPTGAGPFPGIVFFHWLGRPKGDRTQFLDEATALAGKGVVSVLIQGYFPWKEQPKDGPTDRQQIIDQAIEARRAIDLLLSYKEVDRKRVAYVGHDYGSMYGGMLAGIERRVKAFVLIAGLGRFSPWSLKYWPKTAAQGNTAYEQAVAPLDPIVHVAQAKQSSFLFQFANTDEYITKDDALAFFNQAGGPKEIKWYDAGHDLNVEAARKDRDDWLAQQLKIK